MLCSSFILFASAYAELNSNWNIVREGNTFFLINLWSVKSWKTYLYRYCNGNVVWIHTYKYFSIRYKQVLIYHSSLTLKNITRQIREWNELKEWPSIAKVASFYLTFIDYINKALRMSQYGYYEGMSSSVLRRTFRV